MKSKVKIIQEAEKVVIVEVAQNVPGVQKHIVPGNLKKDNHMAFANQTTKRKFDSKAAVDQYQNENKDNPYNNERIDNFLIDGIKHDRHLISENRKFNNKNELVNKMERDAKRHRDLGEKRIEDEASHLNHGQEVLQKDFDPNEPDNGELRGVRANVATQLHSYYTVDNGIASAANFCSKFKPEEHGVKMHSDLTMENQNSMKHANEILGGILVRKMTGVKEVYVTGDNGIEDPEVKNYLSDKEIEEPINSDQKVFDYILTEEKNGVNKARYADLKLRSKNQALSKETTKRDFDTNTTEIWAVGSASTDFQEKVHAKIAQDALEVCDQQPPSKDVDEKKAEILDYSSTKDPKVLDKAKFVSVVVFNNDKNFEENKENDLIPHNIIDED